MKPLDNAVPAKVSLAKLSVSESNLRKAALRLIGHHLVSPEVHYIQRMLGAKATQQQLDDQVMAVRRLPWSKIVVPE
jgi:hypothetical protein